MHYLRYCSYFIYFSLVFTFSFWKRNGAGPSHVERTTPSRRIIGSIVFPLLSQQNTCVREYVYPRAPHTNAYVYIPFPVRGGSISDTSIYALESYYTYTHIIVYMYTCKNRELRFIKEQKNIPRPLSIIQFCVNSVSLLLLFQRLSLSPT